MLDTALAPPACAAEAELSPLRAEPPPSCPVNVLLVDDQPNNLLAMEAVLADLDANLVKAGSGFEALRCLLDKDFALIIMDVRMPELDGFEAAALIRQRERTRHTPIIFLTAVATDDMEMFRGYAVGAVDYLSKPIVPHILRSKVEAFVEIFRKTEQIKRQSEVLRQLEQRQHERALAEARERWESERLRDEIRVARQIQQKLFPAAPLPLPGFDIAGASYPAEATGGDYFDYVPMLDDNLGIVIGDVSGHGFGPALLMAETRAYLRAFLMTRGDVGEVVTLVNRALAADTDDRFATLVLARLDPRTRTLLYASAGHTTGYILDPSGEVKSPLKSTGIPLAVLSDSPYETSPAIALEPGDLVFLHTDGIMEAEAASGQLFGTDRILNVVRANRAKSARVIVDSIYAAVRAFCGAKLPCDDMTAIVMKVDAQT